MSLENLFFSTKVDLFVQTFKQIFAKHRLIRKGTTLKDLNVKNMVCYLYIVIIYHKTRNINTETQ